MLDISGHICRRFPGSMLTGDAHAIANLDAGVTADWLAMDLRAALRHLGELTGEITSDDLLDSIFSRFCIGK